MTDVKIILKNVTIMYPHLFTPHVFNKEETSTGKYQACLLIDKSKTDLITEIRQKIEILANENEIKITPKIQLLMDGDIEKDLEIFSNCLYLNAKNNRQPLTIDNKKELVTDTTLIQNGDFINAVITLWAMKSEYGKRINANLQAVQLVKKGSIQTNYLNDFDVVVDDEAMQQVLDELDNI